MRREIGMDLKTRFCRFFPPTDSVTRVAVKTDSFVFRLKLKVYRMLNIDIEPDADTGLYNKAVVRNKEKGDVHVVNIDPKVSRYFYANFFWDTM